MAFKRELIAVVVQHGNQFLGFYTTEEFPPEWILKNARRPDWEQVQLIYDAAEYHSDKSELNEVTVTTMDGNRIKFTNCQTARFYERKEEDGKQ